MGSGNSEHYTYVHDCQNYGTIHSGNNYTGGIIGAAYSYCKIENCINNAPVDGKSQIAGISGMLSMYSICRNCKNNGNIEGTDRVAGIIGALANSVQECSNTGVIRCSGQYAGGIVADSGTECGQNISLCYNSGEVIGVGRVGGISGYLGANGYSAKETKCYNKGNIIATSKIGGIIGETAKDAQITKCYYLSTIGVEKGVGAVTSGGDLNAQNEGAISTADDVKTYEEFLEWIASK